MLFLSPPAIASFEQTAPTVTPRSEQPSIAVYGPQIKSLILQRTTKTFAAPSKNAEPIAILQRGTRVAWNQIIKSADCPTHWIEIRPRGWFCARVKPSTKEPRGVLLPRVGKKSVIPGAYGRVRSAMIYPDELSASLRLNGRLSQGSVMVRRSGSVDLHGTPFWRTNRGEYIERANIRRLYASKFQGVWYKDAADPDKPVGFVLSSAGFGKDVPVFAHPSNQARVVGQLASWANISILEAPADSRFVRIGSGQWVAKQDLRIPQFSSRPTMSGPDERWIDIDLKRQIAVAYQGSKPVFTTLVSTGKGGHQTPAGEFRVQRKIWRTTMNSRAGARDQYSVADIPWAIYFRDGYALHTSYWHRSFGYKKSHGCINLSPRDAKAMYEFLGPEVHPGWAVAYSHPTQPGSVVRIRE